MNMSSQMLQRLIQASGCCNIVLINVCFHCMCRSISVKTSGLKRLLITCLPCVGKLVCVCVCAHACLRVGTHACVFVTQLSTYILFIPIDNLIFASQSFMTVLIMTSIRYILM